MSSSRALLTTAAVTLAGLGYLACAGQKNAPPAPVLPPPADAAAEVAADALPEVAPLPTCSARPAPDEVRRAAVVATVDAGLGRWLQGVEIEPALVRRKFRGWIVRSMYPGDVCYRDVDLRPGDVVTKVNGKTVEKPEQASAVFESLRTAEEIVIDYERDGTPRALRFRIVP